MGAGNNGYVDKGDKWNVWPNALAHAFPHWSFEKTTAEGDAAMVCDIQGVGFKYTDVTVHTAKRRFGSTDLGERGFEKFFETHTCNDVCKQLGLHPCENTACSAAGGAAAASASTATERIEIIRTKGLDKINLEDLVEELLPKGRSLVPTKIKEDLLSRIKGHLE